MLRRWKIGLGLSSRRRFGVLLHIDHIAAPPFRIASRRLQLRPLHSPVSRYLTRLTVDLSILSANC